MKKRDFSKNRLSKMALAGLATGLLISSQASAETLPFSANETDQQIARGGCPNGKCGTRTDNGSNGRTRRYNPEDPNNNNTNSSLQCHAKKSCKGLGNCKSSENTKETEKSPNGHTVYYDPATNTYYNDDNTEMNTNNRGKEVRKDKKNGGQNHESSCAGSRGCGGYKR